MSHLIDLAEIEAAQVAAEAAEADTTTKRETVRRLNKSIYEGVQAGETTGDRLIDHVVRRNHGYRPEAVELFRSLEEQVAAHVGEPVLVIPRGVDYQTHVFGRGMQNPYVRERIGIGIITGPELNLGDDGEWSFPTDVHLVRGGGLLGELGAGEGRVFTGPLTTDTPDRFGGESSPLEEALDEPLVSEEEQLLGTIRGLRGADANQKRLEIAVGTAEVEQLVAKTLFLHQLDLEDMLDQLMHLPAGEDPGDS